MWLWRYFDTHGNASGEFLSDFDTFEFYHLACSSARSTPGVVVAPASGGGLVISLHKARIVNKLQNLHLDLVLQHQRGPEFGGDKSAILLTDALCHSV